MKTYLTFFLTLLFLSSAFAQPAIWTDISASYDLPDSTRLFQWEQVSPPIRAWYIDVNLHHPDIVVRPYITSSKKGITSFTQSVGAYMAINGGYFDVNGTSSYSAVVYPFEVKAQNVSVLNRSGTIYPATRSFFSLDFNRLPSVNWIWHFDATVDGIYYFDPPTPNSEGNPAATPLQENGTAFDSLMVGLGGGPTLVKNGQVHVTYAEEVFFGSGVGLDNDDPRTAVGYTADNHIILLVVDGRQAASQGVSLTELAQIMIDIGCVDAMNLDGGGSTQMAVGNDLINSPEGSMFERPLVSILAVTHTDSLRIPEQPVLEKTFDTEDGSCTFIGGEWLTSANSGYWGGTPARYTGQGDGSRYAKFSLDLPTGGMYEVYAWWVAAFNRSADTPIVVLHNNQRDTIRVDQSSNGSQWRYIGTYEFIGDTSESVIISNAASSDPVKNLVIADGVRIVRNDTATSIIDVYTTPPLPSVIELAQNYPNPFNGSTQINFSLATTANAELLIFDIQGRKVRSISGQFKSREENSFRWDGHDDQGTVLTSGVYFYQLKASGRSVTKKLMLLR